MAITALAVAVGAGTAGIYTLATTGDTSPAVSYPPVAEAPVPSASNRGAPPASSASAPSPVAPPPTSTRPPAPPPPPETSEPERPSKTSQTEETTEGTSTETTEPESDSGRSPRTLLLALVNEAREEVGCEPVTLDTRLSRAAASHSEDMADRDYFSHLSPDGTSFVERVLKSGYPAPAAENIAMGQRSAERVMRGWMESEGHRENILNCSLTTMGIGVHVDGWYWTQVFGR